MTLQFGVKESGWTVEVHREKYRWEGKIKSSYFGHGHCELPSRSPPGGIRKCVKCMILEFRESAMEILVEGRENVGMISLEVSFKATELTERLLEKD